MTTARVFQSGNSQAVRLPKEFRLDVDEVEIFRQGADIILRPAKPSVSDWLSVLSEFSEDFMESPPSDAAPQDREGLDD